MIKRIETPYTTTSSGSLAESPYDGDTVYFYTIYNDTDGEVALGGSQSPVRIAAGTSGTYGPILGSDAATMVLEVLGTGSVYITPETVLSDR